MINLARAVACLLAATPTIVAAGAPDLTAGKELSMKHSPNIIYILADDMGYGDVSCLNPDSKIRTPHLDQLAAGGMAFRDAHSTSAVCTPSRYSILTGRYNWRSRLKEGVIFGYDGPVLEAGRMTVASLLKQHGYFTACVGKWHLGWDWGRNGDEVDYRKPIRRGPLDAGFDYYFGIASSLDIPPYVYVENDRPTAVPDREAPEIKGLAYQRSGPVAPDFDHTQVMPRLTEKALSVIRDGAKRKQPFFLYFPLTAPHTPILPLPEFAGKSGATAYGDFCLQVDDVVGQVMRAVDEAGLAENTIIVFTSDNGCSPAADISALKAIGHKPSHVYRGYKADIYDGGHRIPYLIRWPAGIAPGSTSDETVCQVDLLATCAELLGVKLPDNAGEDSVSQLPVWRGGKQDRALREATVHHSFDGSFAIRQGRWKLLMCAGSGGWSDPKPGREPPGSPRIQLYDMSADVGERRNVQAEHPDVVASLQALLTRYIEQGRSTPGAPQPNTGPTHWSQLWWTPHR